MNHEERRLVARDLVMGETRIQDQKWGKEREHSLELWCTILMEEVGELAQASLKAQQENGDPRQVVEEAIQVGAVCLQIIEHQLRKAVKDYDCSGIVIT